MARGFGAVLLALAALLLALAAGASAAGAEDAGAAAGRPGSAQRQMLLRLGELPPEYTIGSDSGCLVFGVEEGDSKAVADFARRYRPLTCQMEYQRRFVLPGLTPNPPLVETFAIGTPSAGGAEAGLGIAGELLASFVGAPDMAEAPSAARVGDATKLFHTHDAFALGRPNEPGSAVFWRSGDTLAALYVAGPPPATADGIAVALAQVQQRHVEAPTPYTAAEQDDTVVPFENPAIHFPVYWLGRTFTPGHGLPPSPLRDAFLPIPPNSAPRGMKALLSYDRITIGTWTARSWRKREHTGAGDLLLGWHCTESSPLGLPKGRATVYAGYGKDFSKCPGTPPNVFAAVVHLGGLVIGVDVPGCEYCVESARGPYHSARDMAIIARGLRLRQPPAP